MPKTIVLYHANCPDGFGAAYSAWKKFGNEAIYIPVRHGKPVPEHLAGSELYLLDFTYERQEMDALKALASRIVVLDHHEGVRDVVESIPEHIFDSKRSGATIAWSYFHPAEPVPEFLEIVAKADLYLPLADDERAIISYAYAQPFTFKNWDSFVSLVGNPEERAKLVARGLAYTEHFQLLAAQIAERAELVSFEGHEVYFVSAPRLFATEVGHLLNTTQPPFALIARAEPDGSLRVSMRADTTVDVSAIARKYGGNGHPGAASFSIDRNAPLPWTPIKHEDSRD
ncbi:MAG: hypothetical protein WDN10_01890 [bacterium]